MMKRCRFQIEPLIEEDHESLVHHMLVYECYNETLFPYTAEELHGYRADFYLNEKRMNTIRRCQTVFYAWTIGSGVSLLGLKERTNKTMKITKTTFATVNELTSQPFPNWTKPPEAEVWQEGILSSEPVSLLTICEAILPGESQRNVLSLLVRFQKFWFPANAGMPVGDHTSPVLFRLETHYDNPDFKRSECKIQLWCFLGLKAVVETRHPQICGEVTYELQLWMKMQVVFRFDQSLVQQTFRGSSCPVPLNGQRALGERALWWWFTDVTDHSGLRVWMVPTLRQHDAGIIEAGVSVRSEWRQLLLVPPTAPAFLTRGLCHADCLSDVRKLWNSYITRIHALVIAKKFSLRFKVKYKVKNMPQASQWL